MCSIGGFISKKPLPKELTESLASSLLYFGSVRGDQSSGIYVEGTGLMKMALQPEAFIQLKRYKGMFRKHTTMLLTHTRFPTCGKEEDEQAQPFMANNTVTVHNGYFHNIEALKTTYGIIKPSGVDSELITQAISTFGIETLPSFLSTASGPAAIAAIYQHKMYVVRKTNPLHYAKFTIDNGNAITVFASTAEILRDVLKHCFLKADKIKITEFKKNTMYELTASNMQKVGKKVINETYSYYGESRNDWQKWLEKDERFLNDDDDEDEETATYDMVKNMWE